MIYPHTVTFQEPTPSQTAAGQVVDTYADIEGLTVLPARVVPASSSGETDEQRYVLEKDVWTIIVQGDREVDEDMRAFTSHVPEPLDVVRVQRPVLYRSARTYATIVTAQRVQADDESS